MPSWVDGNSPIFSCGRPVPSNLPISPVVKVTHPAPAPVLTAQPPDLTAGTATRLRIASSMSASSPQVAAAPTGSIPPHSPAQVIPGGRPEPLAPQAPALTLRQA